MELPLKKERIQYIDAMRGFTMLLVVFAHIETFSFDYASTGNITFLGEMFQLFRMPLFFFVSGFIAYKAQVDWNIRYCWDLIKKKFQEHKFHLVDEVLELDKKNREAKLNGDNLDVLKLQPAGKNPMDWRSFVNGLHGADIKIGE